MNAKIVESFCTDCFTNDYVFMLRYFPNPLYMIDIFFSADTLSEGFFKIFYLPF